MKSYEIHFIRHGMTAATGTGAYVGASNVPLSPQGIEKLKELSDTWDYPGTPLLYSSPLLRCVQSCNIIYPALKPQMLDGLKECSFGDWEGKTAKDLANDKLFAQWLANSKDTAPPNGETGADFTRRICRTFERLVNDLMKSGKTTAVVVTHGGVIMTLLSVYGIPQEKSYKWQMDNGFGYSLRISPMLWMRDKVAEVYAQIPVPKEDDEY